MVSEKLKTCILVMDGRRDSIEGGTGDKNGGAYRDKKKKQLFKDGSAL